jgi:hypothetical protein
MRKTVLAIVLALVAAQAVAVAQQTSGCADEKSGQFDFWIGEWDVLAGGDTVGTNTIEPILDGCVLQENWLGAKGSAGSSFNFYNPQKGRWQQFWVWRNGTTLELEGEFADRKMVLSGDSVDREGNVVANRITWYDNPDGTVRQLWEQSKDGGATWQTAFDGLYRKKK